MKKEPRWVVPFLRALERTGQARTAAEDAGIDHTTAYARRRTHAEFAEAWVEALRRRKGAPPPSSMVPLPTSSARREELDASTIRSPRDREELVVSGNQLKRASGERWGKKKQEAFLAELAATGNLRRASAAVGISYEAVRKRRIREPHFDAVCKAAIEACRGRIPEFLASATAQTFDPHALPDADCGALPKVTIAEAIQIAKLPPAEPRPEGMPDNYEYAGRGAWRPRVRTLDEVRDSILEKLDAFARKMREEREPLGWTWDDEHEMLIPPGWVKTTPQEEEEGPSRQEQGPSRQEQGPSRQEQGPSRGVNPT